MSPTNKISIYRPIRRNDRNLVGRMVAKIRREQKLTQEDLAGRLAVVGWDISRDSIKRIESGEREVTDIDLIRLARGLRVPPARLLDGVMDGVEQGKRAGLRQRSE
ncbi:Helix-turn-helix protein [Opitutaceae bacterium TAV1]|nr:Helix-turn-helix protein [Opitutaceae bacterium TAV1]